MGKRVLQSHQEDEGMEGALLLYQVMSQWRLWVRISEQTIMGNIVVIVCYGLPEWEDVDETFVGEQEALYL